jgi:hypothetical protein
MLLPDNIHPEATVYFNGAILLRAAQREGVQPVFGLYRAVQADRAMSLRMFLLCLDWLFLLNLVRLNTRGDVELCF